MQCNSCGATLPPGARNCPMCGTATFASSPTEKTFLSSPGSPVEDTVPGTYPPGTFQESVPPPPAAQPGSSFQAGSYAPTQSATPLPLPYGPPGQPGYPPVQQPPFYSGPQQPPYIPPPTSPVQPQGRPRGRGLSRGMTILLIVLALLIMFSGFG